MRGGETVCVRQAAGATSGLNNSFTAVIIETRYTIGKRTTTR
jgi:hypothetical protein